MTGLPEIQAGPIHFEHLQYKGFSFEKSMDIIREGLGTHFDPLVAQAFLDAEDEVKRVAEEHSRIYEHKDDMKDDSKDTK